MFGSRSVLVVVPARGGSKGLKLKNLRTIAGISLVARVGKVVGELEYVDRAVVSTDNMEIARVARDSGLDAPFYRPPSISGDRISDWEVLIHALRETEDIDHRQYDVIVMLQPTSPMRTPAHVTATIAKLIDGGYDAVWTVSETDSKHHPLKQLTLDDAGRLDYYDPQGAQVIARQQLGAVYHRNGIAYAMTRHCLTREGTIKGGSTGAVVVKEPVANIDSEIDLEWAELLLSRHRKVE